MKQFIFFGMRRCGNHAILEWISTHFNNVTHFNDCYGFPPKQIAKIIKYGDETYNTDLEITSYEDFIPSLEEIENDNVFIIFRDWYNMASSRIVSSTKYPDSNRMLVRERHEKKFTSNNVIGTWIGYAKLYEKYPEKFILYNKWVSDEEYRNSIKDRLGLNGIGNFVNTLPKSNIGKGSSFGDTEISANAVNNRYKVLLNSPELFNTIDRSDVRYYCEKIFDMKI